MPLADADRLRSWGITKDAESRVPELVLRLIEATATVRRRVEGFRTGRGTQIGGYDGFSDLDANSSYLPSAPTVWELGTEESPGSKATGDYDDRTAKPEPVDPAYTTYVAVTSRRWAKKVSWASERDEGPWKEVRAHDIDSLYSWILQARAVHIWISQHLTLYTDGETTAEEWWGEYRWDGAPEEMTVGRDAEKAEFLARVRGTASPLAIQAADTNEAIAFAVASVLESSDPEVTGLLSRIVVVENLHSWRRCVRSGSNLILIPEFALTNPNLAGFATSRGHIVVLPAGASETPIVEPIVLPALDAGIISIRLQSAGTSPTDAARAASTVEESATGLRLALDTLRNPSGPDWARPGSARRLVPVLLAGQWDGSNPHDRAALERLSDRPYQDVTDVLVEWRLAPRPPVKRIGTNWIVADRHDMWSRIRTSILDEDLERFRATAVDCLREDDPKYDIPGEQRFMAGAMGKTPEHSFAIREGLADGLAMIGSAGDGIGDSMTGQDVACLAVRDILAAADWKRWASISPLLTLLAEACPDAFLQAVERDLRGEVPTLAQVFTDQGSSAFGVDSPHVGLLFALERVGRSADHLARTALALGRLDEVDPGGSLHSNRPLQSLTSLLRIGWPQTDASRTQRLQVIDSLRDQFPDTAWKVMLAVLPIHGGGFVLGGRPAWRPWMLETDQ